MQSFTPFLRELVSNFPRVHSATLPKKTKNKNEGTFKIVIIISAIFAIRTLGLRGVFKNLLSRLLLI